MSVQRFEEIYYDGVDQMLDDARSRLARVSPQEAFAEVVDQRALLVDIRPAAQRWVEGEVAAWLNPRVIERNVLEWRFDPRSDAGLPEAAYDLQCWCCARRATPPRSPRTPCSGWASAGRPTSSAASRPGGRPGCPWPEDVRSRPARA